jgi:hypothetical protein
MTGHLQVGSRRLLPLIIGALLAANALAAPMTVVDADEKRVHLNEPGRVTLVVVCTEDSEGACRKAGRVVDPVHGRDDFRQVVIVDLRDSLGGFVEGYVTYRMRNDMDVEAKRLAKVYAANGSKRNPREDMSAVADFEGEISDKLGFTEPSKYLRAILFGKDGKEIKRWDRVRNLKELLQETAKALGLPAPSK